MGDSWTWAKWLEGTYDMEPACGQPGFAAPSVGAPRQIPEKVPDQVKKCHCGHPELSGTHYNSNSIMCTTEWGSGIPVNIVPDPVDDHNVMKAYKATSQADEIMRKANEPHMFFGTGATVPHAQVLDIAKQPAVWAEKLSPTSGRLEIENIPNEQAIEVVLEILPKVVELWMRKSKDYNGASGGLGPKAPFVDIWRKVLKLKRALWEDEELQFEQKDEILMDLIGTCLNILVELS